MTKIAIIGAGLSGLSVARLLKEHADVTVFEKSSGVGGRMSTRRAEPYLFDHGAQYFTARSKAFQDFIKPSIDAGVVAIWRTRYARFDDYTLLETQAPVNEEARYVGVPGMTAMSKYLANGLIIHLDTRIVSLKRRNKWLLLGQVGQCYEGFDWVISTVPSPQAVKILPPIFKYHAMVEEIGMRPSVSLMLGFSKRLVLEFDCAHIRNSDLSWIAVNSHKPGRSEHFTLMVNSSESYAKAHIDDDQQSVLTHLCAETSRIIGYDVNKADYKGIHKWRYANTVKHDKSPIFLDQNLKLAACGDWVLGGRVEGAFSSAYNLANAIKELTL